MPDDLLCKIVEPYVEHRMVCSQWKLLVRTFIREQKSIRMHCQGCRHVLDKPIRYDETMPLDITLQRKDESTLITIKTAFTSDLVAKRPSEPFVFNVQDPPENPKKRARRFFFDSFDVIKSKVALDPIGFVKSQPRYQPYLHLERYGDSLRVIVWDYHRSCRHLEARYFMIVEDRDSSAAFGARMSSALRYLRTL